MRPFETRSEATLYLWDYFYVTNAPQPGDESVWQTIENAACRIRELEPFLRPSVSNDEQLRSARRLRRAVGVIVGQLPRLKAEVAPWISEVLGSLEAEASAIIGTATRWSDGGSTGSPAQGPRTIIAAITDKAAAAKILEHLGLPTDLQRPEPYPQTRPLSPAQQAHLHPASPTRRAPKLRVGAPIR